MKGYYPDAVLGNIRYEAPRKLVNKNKNEQAQPVIIGIDLCFKKKIYFQDKPQKNAYHH